MGGSSSKPVETPTFTPDLSRATIPLEELQRQAAAFQQQASQSVQQVSSQLAAASWSQRLWTVGFWALLLVALGGAAYAIWYILWKTNVTSTAPLGLKVTVPTAMHGTNDVTSAVAQMVNNDSLYIPASLSKNIKGVSGLQSTDKLVLTYQFSDEAIPRTYTVSDSTAVNISPAYRPDDSSTSVPDKSTAPPRAGTPVQSPGFFGKLMSMFGSSGSSGDLMPSTQDATQSSTVPATSAPTQNDGAYGLQWWMFIKDWNYGYGKEKTILKRAGGGVLNPHVSLHPTDNTLKVSISIFPSSEEGSSKTEPSSYQGSTSANDDVFVCEVQNVPLQSWFSVSMTVFGRNLDIYLNGQLVKSCLLPGVPKPSTGDIQLNTDGGFSGYMCNLTNFSRMLTPGDASNYFSAGTSCKSATDSSSATSSLTGYNVKFGLFDTTGKKVDEYVF